MALPDDVLAWAKNETRLETEKYKSEQKQKSVQITFRADRELDYGQKTYQGGYLFLQSIYYALNLDKTCRKIGINISSGLTLMRSSPTSSTTGP